MQPDDRGLLNGIPVLQVRRRGKDAVHFIAESVEVGSSVTGVIDWDRRWDHMQQHSGQHLITAITEILFGFKTTSWWLGENLSHIELGKFFPPLKDIQSYSVNWFCIDISSILVTDTNNITDEQIKAIENKVNEKIRENVPVEVQLYEGADISDQVIQRDSTPCWTNPSTLSNHSTDRCALEVFPKTMSGQFVSSPSRVLIVTLAVELTFQT